MAQPDYQSLGLVRVGQLTPDELLMLCQAVHRFGDGGEGIYIQPSNAHGITLPYARQCMAAAMASNTLTAEGQAMAQHIEEVLA